ncbi:MAG: hypothetical protein HDR26_07215 [Lachnospiraceae bacterium]|nr:hypothetical protein [Lachnospiraceae bacterium]
MKRKIKLLVILMLVATMSLYMLTACGDDEPETNPDAVNDGSGDIGEENSEPAYVGLFTYTKNSDGAINSAYLNLHEDGTFYFASDFLAQDNVGTYEYNADKSQITLDAQLEQALSGTYDVVVEDGNVVIKDIRYFFWEGEWLGDNFTYDTVSTNPVEQPIEIVSFYIQEDKDAHLTFFTGNRYELIVTDPEIISSGTYTESKDGNATVYTLTDTLNGESAAYTFAATYMEADGYSDLLLKGTGIDDAGIQFVYNTEKEIASIFTGTAAHGEGDAATTETVTLTHYADETFEIEFTTWGDFPATATGTYTTDYAAWEISYDIADGVGKDYITALEGAINSETYETTINVTISNEEAFLEYSVELTMFNPVLASGTGTVETNFYNTEATETVTVKYFEDNRFELEFTTMGEYPATVSGTYSEDYGAKTIAYTVTDGEGADCVTSISGIFDDSWATVISITITTQAGEYEAEVMITPNM